MKYTANRGCVFYHDDILKRDCHCEPNILFLLGLEAITQSYDQSLDEYIVLDKYIKDINDPSTSNEIDIFDSICRYLEIPDEYDDIEHIKNETYGLKKYFLNNLTGTLKDRCCPIILRDSTNSKEIYENVIIDIDYDTSNKTKWDLQAQRIKSLFEDAGYDVPDARKASRLNITDDDLLSLIDEYNESVVQNHNKKNYNKLHYKLIDYRAMYAYALGVLYGCYIAGYDDYVIWRIEPSLWYHGDYKNLVLSAWYIFQHHWNHPIKKIDRDPNLWDLYKGIRPPHLLWNYQGDTIEYPEKKRLYKCKDRLDLAYVDDKYYYLDGWYTFEDLQNNHGITETKSSYYHMKDAIAFCWYNKDKSAKDGDGYWDDRNKKWQSIPPRFDGSVIIETINEIGAMGIFLYTGKPCKYGTDVDGSLLKQMCMNFPISGEISCTQTRGEQPTGKWRIYTDVEFSSPENPCIVYATKVSNDTDDTNNNQHISSHGYIETIEYNL